LEPATEASSPQKKGSTTYKITTAILLIVVALGVILVISQADQIWTAIKRANWAELPGAFLFTIAGYTCMGLAFAYVSQMIGVRMRLRDLAEIGFISSIINHVVAAGGFAGYSIRYILMNRHGATMNDVAAASLLHFYLTSLDMIVMTPVALGYLMLNANIPRGVAILLGAMTVLLTVGAILATILIFSQNLRQPILKALAMIVKKVIHRDLTSEMVKFNQTISIGVRAMYEEPRKLILIMLLTILDWVASVIVLSHCLDAFGEHVPIGVVITGFVIGMVAGVLSMIPGGLGVQEGSMTGVFVLLGVPFEQAVLGAVLFRAIFFVFPYLVSLTFYRRLMQLENSPAD
jgi:uncharacterized protein (TIRG00374 family)